MRGVQNGSVPCPHRPKGPGDEYAKAHEPTALNRREPSCTEGFLRALRVPSIELQAQDRLLPDIAHCDGHCKGIDIMQLQWLRHSSFPFIG